MNNTNSFQQLNQTFNWQQFGQDIAIYMSIIITGYFLRKLGINNRRNHQMIHEKLDLVTKMQSQQFSEEGNIICQKINQDIQNDQEIDKENRI